VQSSQFESTKQATAQDHGQQLGGLIADDMFGQELHNLILLVYEVAV
jgi:hypothetical protein